MLGQCPGHTVLVEKREIGCLQCVSSGQSHDSDGDPERKRQRQATSGLSVK
jgi:hypothetical protein